MTYNSLDQIFEEIDGVRGRLLVRTESLSPAERAFRPDPAVWSAEQITEHLAQIERNMLRLIHKLLRQAEAAAAPAPSDGSIPETSMDEFDRVANANKFEAPEPLRPMGVMNAEQSLASLRESRAEIRALRPRLAATDLSNVTFPHPFAGPLNLYQWLAFIGKHEGRHLEQIERTVAAPAGARGAGATAEQSG